MFELFSTLVYCMPRKVEYKFKEDEIRYACPHDCCPVDCGASRSLKRHLKNKNLHLNCTESCSWYGKDVTTMDMRRVSKYCIRTPQKPEKPPEKPKTQKPVTPGSIEKN